MPSNRGGRSHGGHSQPSKSQECCAPAKKFYHRHPKAVLIGGIAIIVGIIILIIVIVLLVVLLRSGLDKEVKQKMLDHHNYLRHRIANGLVGRQPSGSNIVLLDWDDRLAKNIENWLAKCTFQHNSMKDRAVGSYEHGGQNLAGWSITNADVTEGIWDWFEEEKDFTHGAPYPGSVLHYTQMLWAETVAVGCSRANCTGKHLFQSQLGCDYAPMGNWNNESPYLSGSPCSACPSNYPKCHEGLCATADQCSKGKLSCSGSTSSGKSIKREDPANSDGVIARVVKDLTRPTNQL